MDFIRKSLITACAILGVASVYAANTYHHVAGDENLKWQDMPKHENVKFAVLAGNPDKKGFFTVRIKFPADFYMAPHFHNNITEYDTVLSGTFYIGKGNKPGKEHGIALNAGSFVVVPANSVHSSWTKEPTIVQISGYGPWGAVEVNKEKEEQHS